MKGCIDWTAGEIECLRVLCDEGHSFSIIGKMMGRTKGSIVGKVHRLGFPAREPCVRPAVVDGNKLVRLREARLVGASKVTLPALSVPLTAVEPVMAITPTLSRKPCQWPMWGKTERPTHRYCGATSSFDRPYCAAHCSKAYFRMGAEHESV